MSKCDKCDTLLDIKTCHNEKNGGKKYRHCFQCKEFKGWADGNIGLKRLSSEPPTQEVPKTEYPLFTKHFKDSDAEPFKPLPPLFPSFSPSSDFQKMHMDQMKMMADILGEMKLSNSTLLAMKKELQAMDGRVSELEDYRKQKDEEE